MIIRIRTSGFSPSEITQDSSIKNIVIIAVVYFVSTAIFITLFSGWAAFFNSLLGPFIFQSIKDPVHSLSYWPNVLTTVAELNEGSISAVVNSIAANFSFSLALLALC